MRRVCFTLLLCTAGCGLRDVPGPPGLEQIVVQSVLNAQTAEQVLWIERSIPAGGPISSELRPLATPPTRVEVSDTAGSVFAFQPDTTNAARFVAAFSPMPGMRYELFVDVGEQVLRASTRVPEIVTIVDPAADTISATRNSPLRLTWVGPIRPIRVTVADTSGRQFIAFPEWVTLDTAVVVQTLSGFPAIGIWVLSCDSVTARAGELFPPVGVLSLQFRGNISGGVGLFGAVTGDHIIVRLQ